VNPEVGERAAALRRDRVPFVHARVVRALRPTSATPGDEALVLPDGTVEGFVGGACAESTVRAQSLSLLDSGESLLLRISPEGEADGAAGERGDSGEDGALTVVNPCLSGGTIEIFLEPAIPAPALVVHGESPIARALVALAPGLGFQVTADVVAGAGPPSGPGGVSAVVVASHGRDEEPAIEAAVRTGVPYVGLVASRKRGEAVIAALDLDAAQKAAVHSPAGLDIGARTPSEVALSILAEIVALRPRASGVASPPATAATTGDGVAPPPDAAHAGERPPVATDLVCGMSVVADEAALHLDHDGTRYWFCGSGCLRAFAADPGVYLPGPAG